MRSVCEDAACCCNFLCVPGLVARNSFFQDPVEVQRQNIQDRGKG